MGGDDSMIQSSIDGQKSTDTLAQIFEMIDAGKEEGLVITPGQINLHNQFLESS
jgi:hypothetical protein